MESFRKIKEHFRLTPRDEERLRALYPVIAPKVDSIIQALEERIQEVVDPALKNKIRGYPELANYHRKWLMKLLRGPYDGNYYRELTQIGKRHAALEIPPHYVSVAMNTVRVLLIDILTDEIEDRRDRTLKKASLNKMLDLNLDIITSAYVEEELYQYSALYRVKSRVLQFAENFTSAMNLFLIIALLLIGLGVIGLFVYDVVHFFRGGISGGIISALGTLLVFWVLIELMNTEIEHLKGGRFNISVFIGVAIVAFIRDIMVATLKHEKIDSTAYFLAGAILILGVVYFLVTKAETRKEDRT